MKIAVDAMGGDLAPEEVVKGVFQAVKKVPVEIHLFGNADEIEKVAQRHNLQNERVIIHHTEEYISGDEDPREAVEEKPEASILKAARFVGNEQAGALVAAGNTGAVILAARKFIPRILGVRKTAIATVYPTLNYQQREDYFSLLLDVGANVNNTVEELVQFAFMGSVYAAKIKGIDSPAVALLNNGVEPYKGGEKYTRVYQILSRCPEINFIGNIEGNDLMKGLADVVVTEGFIGNILMKTVEGLAETLKNLTKAAFKQRLSWKLGLLALSSGIKRLKNLSDYKEYGGAPVLGFSRMVIKCHGKSTARAISNAIKLALKSINQGVCEKITNTIREYETFPLSSFSSGE